MKRPYRTATPEEQADARHDRAMRNVGVARESVQRRAESQRATLVELLTQAAKAIESPRDAQAHAGIVAELRAMAVKLCQHQRIVAGRCLYCDDERDFQRRAAQTIEKKIAPEYAPDGVRNAEAVRSRNAALPRVIATWRAPDRVRIEQKTCWIGRVHIKKK